MFQQIEQLLSQFRPCFSRKAAFGWFVTVIAEFMLRGDQLGVTSVIRDLLLSPACYELLIHFFHSDAWDSDVIRKTWWKLLAEKAPVYRVRKRCILIGDGVKQSKEAFHMAGVKKLLQESENSSKPQYIFGHMFGAVGILIGRSPKRGHPRLKGASVPVASLFTDNASCFTSTSVYMYGDKQEVTYYCTDLL